MTKIADTFNFGDPDNITHEKLLELLEIMYRDLAVAINKKPNIIERDDVGQTTDTFLSNGDININTTTAQVEMLTSHDSPTSVTWTTL